MKNRKTIDSLVSGQIKVLLVEDNTALRKSLKILIESDDGFVVVGEGINGLEAIKLNLSLHPEVIVMDIAMPLLNGLQATRRIMETSPATKVLILSANPDPEYIEQAVTFGASGYLIKQSSTEALNHAVHEVFEGNSYFSSSIAKPLRDDFQVLFGKVQLLKKKTAARLALGIKP